MSRPSATALLAVNEVMAVATVARASDEVRRARIVGG